MISAFEESFSDLTGEELLFVAFTKQPEQAAQLMYFSTFEQAEEMLGIFIAARSGGRSAFYHWSKDAPRDYLDWLTRHLFLRYAEDPRVKEGAEGPARQGTKVLIPLSRPVRKASGRAGKPVDYMAPINAQILARLEREINKHVRPVGDHGLGSIARKTRRDRSTIRRYLSEDLLLKVTPDGKGGVYTELVPETFYRSMECAIGRKPGPKPKATD